MSRDIFKGHILVSMANISLSIHMCICTKVTCNGSKKLIEINVLKYIPCQYVGYYAISCYN